MSDPIFQDYGPYARLRSAAASVNVPSDFSVEAAPREAWPTLHGSAGKASRSSEPVVAARYHLVWRAPLGAAVHPQSLLVGGGFIVVNGEGTRAVFGLDGRPGGLMKRGGGPGLLDGDRHTFLAEDGEAGLCTYILPEGTRDAFVMLARPQPTYSRDAIQGPGVIAMLSVKRSHLGEPPGAFIETFRVRDWRQKSELNILQGLTPLAGLVRVKDGSAIFAAAPTGPVVATPDGILWCDWLLHPRAERGWETQPQAISVGNDARARMTCSDGISCQVWLASPDDTPVHRVDLPWSSDLNWTPPLVAPDGGTLLSPRGYAWSLAPDGEVRWRIRRDENEPMGTLSSNGLLLLAGVELYVLTPAKGHRHILWKPPARLTTPPIVAGGRIYVASAEELFALAPG